MDPLASQVRICWWLLKPIRKPRLMGGCPSLLLRPGWGYRAAATPRQPSYNDILIGSHIGLFICKISFIALICSLPSPPASPWPEQIPPSFQDLLALCSSSCSAVSHGLQSPISLSLCSDVRHVGMWLFLGSGIPNAVAPQTCLSLTQRGSVAEGCTVATPSSSLCLLERAPCSIPQFADSEAKLEEEGEGDGGGERGRWKERREREMEGREEEGE